jgi:hypothetical protein
VTRSKRPIEDVSRAVSVSYSAAQALRALGLVVAGGNYATLRGWIRDYSLDTSHWLGKAHLRGRRNEHAPKYDLSYILVVDSPYRGGTHLLKQRLIAAGLLTEVCDRCGLSDWQGESISLHLDHINGHRFDHRLQNLRILCPNCHSLTATYCGRNKKLRSRRAPGSEVLLP